MLRLETGKFLGDNKRAFDADGVIVSETEYRRKVFEGWHSHANHHVTLILRGGNCERRKGKEFAAAPGSVLFYRRGELHRNSHTRHPSKNVNLEIEDSFLSRYQADVPAFDSPRRCADVKFSLLKIYKECQAADAQTFAAIHSLALALLDSSFDEKSSGGTPPWIKIAREILNDRWNEVLPLDELARLAGVHPVTISKKFPKHFACTLGEYARKIKIEKSLALLAHLRVPLTEIAYRCGFADQSHFTRVFKSATGFTPREFRNFSGG
jgi:AraC family transcriptional regulator